MDADGVRDLGKKKFDAMPRVPGARCVEPPWSGNQSDVLRDVGLAGRCLPRSSACRRRDWAAASRCHTLSVHGHPGPHAPPPCCAVPPRLRHPPHPRARGGGARPRHSSPSACPAAALVKKPARADQAGLPLNPNPPPPFSLQLLLSLKAANFLARGSPGSRARVLLSASSLGRLGMRSPVDWRIAWRVCQPSVERSWNESARSCWLATRHARANSSCERRQRRTVGRVRARRTSDSTPIWCKKHTR